MESNMFPEPEVKEMFKQMVLVRLYTDALRPAEKRKLSEKNQELQLKLANSTALPLYIVAKPDGTPVTIEAYTTDKEKFVKFMRDGIAGATPKG